MTPAALARVLCDAYAPIAGADGWDGIEAFPIDRAAWLAVAHAALSALTPSNKPVGGSPTVCPPGWVAGGVNTDTPTPAPGEPCACGRYTMAADQAVIWQPVTLSPEAAAANLIGWHMAYPHRRDQCETPPPPEPEVEWVRWRNESGCPNGAPHRDAFIAGYNAALARARRK